MKRLLPILVLAGMTVSSCGLLNMVGLGNSRVAATISAIAPNPRNLTAQEDPGTGLYGYLNEYGVWVIAPTFRYTVNFDSDLGLAVVQIANGRWGAIDVYAQPVIKYVFESRYDVESAMRSISKGRYVGIDLWEQEDPATGLWGYLDYYGNWYIQPQYRYATGMYEEGCAVVQFANELWGAIDRMNKVVVQPNFKSRYDAESALRTLLSR